MIIWDTGPLVAAADADDKDHARCVDLMRRTPRPLLVPYPVLTEVCYLLEREKGTRAEAALLRSISLGQLSLVPLAREDVERMAELVDTYADFPLGAVDASVFAVAERLGADAIATLDRRHFTVVRAKRPFALLP
ncbi:PIN domain-containing protein [Streptomyces sp. NBC_00237]|uniref:type II toxin-antitoxin system VapC family toxin n=1 Tax=Streptomyces sp. NBC_00237 TaxID=2975687 RepID=UPI0022534C75|nr:PIN domain-containing protein [Streptomyces sp. NBC_00237]MCX5204595.1 PIN domain-containing protein [Streptomyces sp. NBC_00237]